MMYLTRVELNTRRRETISALSSPQVMHAAVMAGFPAIGRTEGRVLWRVDSIGEATYLLVQSPGVPDYTHAVEQFGWPASGQGWDTIECDKFITGIKNGDVRRFRITVNPVRSVPVEGGRGKVCHHITASQQLNWFVSRSSKCGFSVDEKDDDRCFASIVSRDMVKFKHGESNVTLSKVTVEGILKVIDADLLRQSINSGIGKGKAYGCGMLSLSGAQRWLFL